MKLRSGHHSRYLLLCACLALLSGSSLAQPSNDDAKPGTASLPGWIVLVLKPIGADRVRPVTGVVVAEQGLVVVPLDFAAPGDQIIVLDGGTDIIANGRAATVRQQITDAGLAVLSVPGLKRHPASLSAMPLTDGEDIRLAAFPPAEQIAEGAAPIWAATQVTVANTTPQSGGRAQAFTAIAAGKLLPNVSGPLLDGCGNLVGFSSADGVQSMDTAKAPAYLWKESLLQALKNLPVDLAEMPCPAVAVTALGETPAAVTRTEEDAAATALDSQQPSEPGTNDSPTTAEAPPPAMVMARVLRWLGLLALAFLAGLFWWLVRHRAISTNQELPGSEHMAAGTQKTEQSPAVVRGPDKGVSQADCVLEISGRLPNGTPFISSCDVNGAAINVVIGRGRVDIAIDSKDVHREHARLSGSGDMLTISDLGSSRGTWINRVPCLKGEIMFIGFEDTIFLGDVSFQVAVRPRQPRSSDSSGHS